jgi:hypothetical protein
MSQDGSVSAVLQPDSNSHDECDSYYFAASTSKFIIMSICSLGLYEIYWFYKNFWQIKKREQSKINPAIRSLFSPFIAYSCFKRIQKTATEQGVSPLPSIGFLATSYFVVNALYTLPDPYWFISIFGFLAVIPVNTAAQSINKKLTPNSPENSAYSGWNWSIIIIGGLILVMAVFSTLFLGR